ncbi:helix-turn-helix domain-containing protein [Crossiella cryophila]|uniref:Transcriptional regulator with XRE-family HTH domain n=1 Tax=Crossiella cryophila TaxID=43355 RepID=A0A7W7CBX3_9PSEU|nr:helix-turn-helix domain-containing protein [Crossiella cryophila]MBB4678298.1 transcriptional regulator with XRE-family HTH domain [Crossiella cryophila]
MLREFRLRAGMTQEELAEGSGVSARTISLLETGRREAPRLASARLLAEALSLPVEERGALFAATRGEMTGLLPTQQTGERTTTTETAVQVGSHGFLPYDVPDFVGRDAELNRLRHLASLSASTVIAVLDGMAGIGKSALAVHAGHALTALYPDGQFYCDLRGFSQGHQPLDPAEALEALLRMVNVPSWQIPPTVDERAALWRASVAGQRVLVVLDNVSDTDQVRPLLPGTAGSLVVVTSRRRLPALAGAIPLSLDVLPPGDALRLFTRVAGRDRMRDEEASAAEIVKLCGFLPMAVRIAAVRLANRPSWTTGHLAERLRDDNRRLGELAVAGMPGVATTFTLSYRLLDQHQLRLFRLLGRHGGEVFDPDAAATLAGLTPMRAEELLETLVDNHLLLQPAPGRYTFHELLRDQARSLTED